MKSQSYRGLKIIRDRNEIGMATWLLLVAKRSQYHAGRLVYLARNKN
ncbi:MAG: hypothetical protein NZ901_09470 [Geminocystis sp.]|nr:hypothetical protein [Geminocystis sp.]MDW8116008.1 hypothetical protein [Geminocystis sp.]